MKTVDDYTKPRLLENQGHQGDVAVRRVFQKEDGNYYVKVLDRAKSMKMNARILMDKLFATAEQMAMELAPNTDLVTPSVGKLTLVEGEATHHHHVLEDQPGVRVLRKGENKGIRLFLAEVAKNDGAVLEHYHVKKLAPTKEHAPIQLPKSIYEFRSQRELDFEKRIRPVSD